MTKLSQFKLYLAEQKQIQLDCASELSQEGKQDEAIMAKITANMYNILTMFSNAAEKNFPDNAFARITCFMETELRTPWQQSLATAEQHADHVKVAHENIKLSTLAEIEKVLNSIFQGGDE